jgi:hypothetical protein
MTGPSAPLDGRTDRTLLQNEDLNMQDIQVATISHKETQTGVGVSCQVRPFEWMNISPADCEIKSGRFVTAEEANDAVSESFHAFCRLSHTPLTYRPSLAFPFSSIYQKTHAKKIT